MNTSSTRPPILIASVRPQTGRTLLTLMVADWLDGRDQTPCVLADVDTTRGTLSRLTGQTAVPVGKGTLPDGAIVDNAQLLGIPDPEDKAPLPGLRSWLAERASSQPQAPKPLILIPIQDHRHSDCAKLAELRPVLTPALHGGVVVIRNAGAPSAAHLTTIEDQEHTGRGGWGNSSERQAWLIGGGTDMVLARPSMILLRHLKMVGCELLPSLATQEDSPLWSVCRQQFLAWRRGFNERAERTLRPLLPNVVPIRS